MKILLKENYFWDFPSLQSCKYKLIKNGEKNTEKCTDFGYFSL